jgi:hypothetical protein
VSRKRLFRKTPITIPNAKAIAMISGNQTSVFFMAFISLRIKGERIKIFVDYGSTHAKRVEAKLLATNDIVGFIYFYQIDYSISEM